MHQESSSTWLLSKSLAFLRRTLEHVKGMIQLMTGHSIRLFRLSLLRAQRSQNVLSLLLGRIRQVLAYLDVRWVVDCLQVSLRQHLVGEGRA